MTSLYPLIVEAALRALVAAVAVWAGLRVLRVANVLVLKTAWASVLVAAFVLPLAPGWLNLPAITALKLPALPSFSDLRMAAPSTPASPALQQQTAAAPEPSPATVEPYTDRYSSPTISNSRRESSDAMRSADADAALTAIEATPKPEITAPETTAPETTAPANALDHPAPVAAKPGTSLTPARVWTFLLLLYFSVASALLLRLAAGLVAAARLWITAKPISILCNPSFNIRSSARVASPVNIGSGIVLPAEYRLWDDEKLRIVLAHERSHIRQGDFYLQLLAGLYACVFWFSPLGWWLKRMLYELGEAISDRAGLEEAASRASYAQLLLEFAALPRPTLTGVAMARTSHLSQRIERLLNESSFRQAFATGGRRALIAIVLVPLAVLTATGLVTVQAAKPSAQTQPAAITGQSTPEQVTEPAPQAPPAAVPAPEAAPAPAPTSAPDAMPAPPAPSDDNVVVMPAPAAPRAPEDAEDGQIIVVPNVRVMPRVPRVHIAPRVMVMPQIAAIPPMPPMGPMHLNIRARDFAFAYGFGQDGEPYAVVGSDGKVQRPHNGWFFNDGDNQEEIEKARKQAHGAFLWFQRDGKSYILEDPSVLEQIEAMNKPMDDLQTQMKDLGKQMRELGEQQREKARTMRDAAVQTPDISKELEELKAAQAALQAKQGATITQSDVRDFQRDIGRIQGELGSLQGKLAMEQSGIGRAMGEFGEQQGKLGGQMGKLGAEMGRIARENQSKIDAIIKDSLSNGKAKQVQ